MPVCDICGKHEAVSNSYRELNRMIVKVNECNRCKVLGDDFIEKIINKEITLDEAEKAQDYLYY